MLLVIGGWRIPESWSSVCEGAVAVMLIFLGVRALWDWHTGRGHLCVHEHGGHSHVHFHRFDEHECEEDSHADDVNHPSTHKAREKYGEPFWMGAIHGLGGSGAMLLLILSSVSSPSHALSYIVAFGAGLMISMFVMTAVVSRVLSATSHKGENHLARWATGLAGVASLGLGIFLSVQLLNA